MDLLFCNEGEAVAYTETPDVEAACTALGRSVGSFAVTCGPRGALVKEGERVREVPGRQVKAVDTNGAGDMFAGAFLFAITNGYTSEQAARLGNYAAGEVVSQYGPRLDRSLKPEIDRILAT